MENEYEQFEKKQFKHEIETQHELEKIGIVEKKLMEEYGEYRSLADFIIYLSAMEKIFVRSRIYGSGLGLIKEEIMKADIRLYSVTGVLDEDILHSIKDNFSLAYMTVSQVYSVAEKLMKKFSDNKKCQDFIRLIRDISIAFIEAHDKKFTINELQDQICRSRMKIVSVDGDPELSVLEKIYTEFKNELNLFSK